MNPPDNGTPKISSEQAVIAVQIVVPAVLTVTMDAQGRCTMNYPMNEMVARYLLEQARKMLDGIFPVGPEARLVHPGDIRLIQPTS